MIWGNSETIFCPYRIVLAIIINARKIIQNGKLATRFHEKNPSSSVVKKHPLASLLFLKRARKFRSEDTSGTKMIFLLREFENVRN